MDFTRETFEDENFGNVGEDLFTFANLATLDFDFGAEPEYLETANNDEEEGEANIDEEEGEDNIYEEGGEDNIDEEEENLATGDDNRALLDPQAAAADARDAAIDQDAEGKKIILKKESNSSCCGL